jgi:hypothetical protein
MSKFLVMYGVEVSLDTGTPTTPNFQPFGDGWENISEALNEVVYSGYFLKDKGFGNSEVTAMQPAFTLTGKRKVGDPLQDYIFDPALKYGLGEVRKSTIKVDVAKGDGTIQSMTCPVTLTNIQEFSGNTQDGSAISLEVRFNGQPTFDE